MDQPHSGIYAALIESLPLGVIIWRLDELADDESLRLVCVNRFASAMLGVDLSSLVGRRMLEVFPLVGPERLSRYADVVRSGLGTTRAPDDYSYGDHRVERSAFATSAVAIGDQCVAALIENLTTKHRQEHEIRRLNAFMSAIVDNMPAMVFVKNARDLSFELFNRSGEHLLGVPRGDLLGKTDLDLFPREIAEVFQAKDREVLHEGALHEIPEEPVETATGRRWLHTRKIPILDERGTPQHLLGISLDITERREAEVALRLAHDEQRRQADLIERMSLTDELTGLYNRRGFMTLAEQHARVALRSDKPFAILFADLDGLKAINDVMGHDFGDRALKKTAAVLQASVREADIVARLGGDEFVVLLDGATPPSVAAINSRIREGLAHDKTSEGVTEAFSISIGAAFQTPERPRTLADLMVEADREMYSEKRRHSSVASRR